nr:HEAT repeat domain-containing protein [Tessaracoccus coleopterorum]
MRGGDAQSRHALAHVLGKLRDAASAGTLVELLADTDERVAAKAAFSLGQVGGDEAVTALVEALREPRPGSGMRWSLRWPAFPGRSQGWSALWVPRIRRPGRRRPTPWGCWPTRPRCPHSRSRSRTRIRRCASRRSPRWGRSMMRRPGAPSGRLSAPR